MKRPFYNFSLDGQVIAAIVSGNLPQKPESLPDSSLQYRQIWNLCEVCWVKEPGKRPMMEHIIMNLKDMLFGISSLEPVLASIRRLDLASQVRSKRAITVSFGGRMCLDCSFAMWNNSGDGRVSVVVNCFRRVYQKTPGINKVTS